MQLTAQICWDVGLVDHAAAQPGATPRDKKRTGWSSQLRPARNVMTPAKASPDLYPGTAQNTRTRAVKNTNPDKTSICVLLARGDHAAGFLLRKIVHWMQYGKAKVKGAEGEWVANDREWWMREAQLSAGQLDRALAKLDNDFDLIERQQAKFAGRNIVHVRPSKLTTDILASAKTWDAAAEILAQAKIPAPTLAKHENVALPLSVMIAAWGGEVTPQEIGALAKFREDIKVVEYGANTYDLTTTAPLLISWAKANWIEISTKEAPKPSLAHFCDGLYGAALEVTMKHKDDAIVFAPD
jgi:hypothetical protein